MGENIDIFAKNLGLGRTQLEVGYLLLVCGSV